MCIVIYILPAFSFKMSVAPNQTVITSQIQQSEKREWSSGLCDCTEDVGVCK